MKEKNNIPKGYKSSPIGLIPNDWNCVTFDSFSGFKNGLNFSKEDKGDGLKIIGVGDFQNHSRISYASLEKVRPPKNISKEYILIENDLLFVRSNGNKDLVGRNILINNLNEEVSHSGFTIRARLNTSKASPHFYSLVFKSSVVRKQYLTLGGGTNISNLSQDILSSIIVPYPPLPEQKAIYIVLNNWDESINTLTQLIAQKELRKKYLMQQLLTGKKRLKGFKGEWVKYSYENLLKIVKRDFDWSENEPYKLISVRRRSGGIFFRETLYGHQILVKNLRTVNKGDFLFSKMQILHGASALVTKEFDGAKISGSYIAVVAKDKKVLSIEFFEWYSKTPYFYHQTYISSYGVHIEKMTFNFESFLTLDIRIPSVEEQNAISNVLQTAENELRLLRVKLEQLKEQKKGLMQILITGKKRLVPPKTTKDG